MAKQKKCEPGKHVFSGLDWAKGRATTKKFTCKKCQEKVPFIELSPEVMRREMKTAGDFLFSKFDKLVEKAGKK